MEIKTIMEKLYQMIEAQQKGRESTPAWMIGGQLKEIAAHEPACAELLEKDLVVEGRRSDALKISGSNGEDY